MTDSALIFKMTGTVRKSAANQQLLKRKRADERDEQEKIVAKEETITEFGGWPGALFLIFSISLMILYVPVSCDQNQCSFTKLPDFNKYSLLSTFFHLESTLLIVAFIIILAILTLIPFGGKKVPGLETQQGTILYTLNGLFCFVICLTIMIVLEVCGVRIFNFILEHRFHLTIVSYFVGLVLAIYVCVRSYFTPSSPLNANVLNETPIYGFVLGREVNPRILGIDLKMYVFHYSVLGAILITFALLYSSFERRFLFNNPTLLVLCSFQLIYLFDAFITESVWLSSFEILYEGFGFISTVGYLLYPFMYTSIATYVFDYNVHLPLWKLIVLSMVFCVGFVLYRGSNSQKDAFRRNPKDPKLAHLETIPTKNRNKSLLCSGFWGIVRHPNYVGDMLMNISYVLFAPNVPAALPVISFLFHLIHRTDRDNTRCRIKYGPAWDQYCAKVKYILVPKIY